MSSMQVQNCAITSNKMDFGEGLDLSGDHFNIRIHTKSPDGRLIPNVIEGDLKYLQEYIQRFKQNNEIVSIESICDTGTAEAEAIRRGHILERKERAREAGKRFAERTNGDRVALNLLREHVENRGGAGSIAKLNAAEKASGYNRKKEV